MYYICWRSFIPESEVWIKLGGDKGGDVLNTFKMNFQIVNVAAPNSVHKTSRGTRGG